MAKSKRSTAGYVGVKLIGKDGDPALYNRLKKEAKATTMSQSLIVRLALLEYFDKRDNKT